MNEKRVLELFGGVDEKYIEEAFPQKYKKQTYRISPILIAACLCLLVIAGFGVWHLILPAVDEKYYTTNIDEVMEAYEGELLIDRIACEGVDDADIQLCYTGNELPLSSDSWKTLSLSASYEDGDVTMNCAFNGETFTADRENAVEVIRYGDTTIEIYQEETESESEVTYYAVFEYQNVCYELKTYSNEKDFLYEILQTVLGENGKESENISGDNHNFPDVLGYRDYYVTVEQTMPGFIIQKYYAEVEGAEKCLAQVYGYVVPGPEVYSKDLDCDGINELICNCIAGTGAERVYIFRNNNGVIERGYISYERWRDTGITNIGSSYIQENYIAESNTFEIVYQTEAGTETIVIEDLDVFVFEEFAEEF